MLNGIDLWCEPEPRRIEALTPLGLLKRIVAEGPCAFEFFHEAPALDELLESLRKVLVLRRPALVPPRRDEPWLCRFLPRAKHAAERGRCSACWQRAGWS